MTTRPSYTTFVVERPVAAPRDVVWRELLALVGPDPVIAFTLGGHDLVETVLSLEPPWRRSYEITSGAPLALYNGTTTIRDDGPTCLLVWSYVADRGDHAGAEPFLVEVQAVLRRVTERVALAAEGVTPPTT